MKVPEVERVAESHFMIRPQITHALKQIVLTDDARRIVRDYETYLDLWQGSYSDRFYDMSAMIQLGSAIERGLTQFHADHGGSPQPAGTFQKLANPDQLLALVKNDCTYDLATNPAWTTVRETMIHRHLFAHRTGLVDDRYLDQLKEVTGQDVRPDVVLRGYPADEVYWFRPLGELPRLIEGARKFFHALPSPAARPGP